MAFNIVWIKIFDIDSIIEDVVCVVYYLVFSLSLPSNKGLYYSFLIYIINIKHVLFHYSSFEMAINIFRYFIG